MSSSSSCRQQERWAVRSMTGRGGQLQIHEL
jgi:hypothetical protein